jgi:hypothetical protein
MANKGGLIGGLRRLFGHGPATTEEPPQVQETVPAAAEASSWEPASAEDLVARYLEARGGRERLAAVQSVRMVGKVTGGELKGNRIVIEKKRPSSGRRLIDDKGGLTIHAVQGDIAWEVGAAIDAPKARPSHRVASRRLKRASDIDGVFVDAKAKGHRLELAGRERVGATDAFKVKIHFKEGDPGGGALFFDAARGLLVKSVEMMFSPGGLIVPAEATFSDYREVDGLLWPFSEVVVMPRFGLRWTYVWETLEVNVRLDEAVFSMPGR